ncbi:MAG: transglycosylase SLT domain-containing protein [Gammaproteobacteria bacterium]
MRVLKPGRFVYRWLTLLGAAWPWIALGSDNADWKKLLRSTDTDTQTEWAQRYEHGEGVEQNFARAIKLYCAAGKRGSAQAQYNLGWLYANGRGVQRNDSQAAAWFRLAAKQGDPHARRMLGFVDDPKRKLNAVCPIPEATSPKLLLARVAPVVPPKQIAAWVHKLAPNYGLDPKLVLAVIQVESAFDMAARSPKNAQGLMQLIPATAERFGVQDVFDPLQNLRGGMAYLRWLLLYFQGDLQLALAGYNAGEQSVQQYKGIPPFPETQAYVAKVIGVYGAADHPPVMEFNKPARTAKSARNI